MGFAFQSRSPSLFCTWTLLALRIAGKASACQVDRLEGTDEDQLEIITPMLGN